MTDHGLVFATPVLSEKDQRMPELVKKNLLGCFTLLPIEAVHYGAGSVAGLEASLTSRGVRRALLITGNTIATRTEVDAEVITLTL